MYELNPNTTLQSGKYRIIKKIGQGTFGITYLAESQIQGNLGNINIQVAIKEFFMKETNTRSSNNTSVTGSQSDIFIKYREKFKTEAKNLAKMSNYDDIVKVFDVFEENNTAYFSMEYIQGSNLDDFIKLGKLTEADAIRYIKDIATALKHLHDNRMLHLDLKPKNVMRNNDGELFLIDFGLSKQYDENGEPESSSTIGLGTQGYAPLEQANFKGEFAPTLDIYALGATFYKMLTGVTPPPATDIFNDGFESLAQKMSSYGISEKTIAIVEKAMRIRKASRYQSVDEFLSALGSFDTRKEQTAEEINELGKEYYKKQDYKNAYGHFRRAAEMGNAAAMYNMGICFELGRYITPSKQTAMTYYKSAADHNFPGAKEKYEKLMFEERTKENNNACNAIAADDNTAKMVGEIPKKSRKIVKWIIIFVGIIICWFVFRFIWAYKDLSSYESHLQQVNYLTDKLNNPSDPRETIRAYHVFMDYNARQIDKLYDKHHFYMPGSYHSKWNDIVGRTYWKDACANFVKQTPKFMFDDVEFYDETGEQILRIGSVRRANIIITPLRDDGEVTLQYKLFLDGKLQTNAMSPVGYTGEATISLRTYSSSIINHMILFDDINKEGFVYMEIWYDGKLIWSNPFRG